MQMLPTVATLLCATILTAQQQAGESSPPTPAQPKATTAGSAKAGASRATGGGNLRALLSGSAAGKPEAGVDGELQNLKRSYMQALVQHHRDRLAAMRKQGQQPKTFSIGPAPTVIAQMAPRFLAAAKKYEGKDDAMPFLEWCLLTDPTPDNPTATKALAAFFTEPLAGPKCAAAVARFARLQKILGKEFDATIARVLELSRSDEVTAAALVARARAMKGTDKAKALADFDRALELAPEASFAGAVRGERNGLTILAVGQPAPEIAAEDLDGVPFRLSDYRGKAVMLSFWGDW